MNPAERVTTCERREVQARAGKRSKFAGAGYYHFHHYRTASPTNTS